jgi:hypothetical protein
MQLDVNQNNIGALIGALAAAWAAWLTYKAKKESNKKDKFALLLESESKLIVTLTEEISGLKKELSAEHAYTKELNAELLAERERLMHLRYLVSSEFDSLDVIRKFCEYIPTPTWLKSAPVHGETYSKMLFINQAYENEWGISKSSYEGKYDIDLWPEKIALKFAANDNEIVKKRMSIVKLEEVPIEPFVEYNINNLKEWIIWKFPVTLEGKIAVGGMAIEKDANKHIGSYNILSPKRQ